MRERPISCVLLLLTFASCDFVDSHGVLDEAAEAVGEVAARGRIPVPRNIYLRIALDATPFVLAIETVTPHARPDSIWWMLDGAQACRGQRIEANIPGCKVQREPFYQIWRNGYSLAIWRMVGPWNLPCWDGHDVDVKDCMYVRYHAYYPPVSDRSDAWIPGVARCRNYANRKPPVWRKHPWHCPSE